MQKKLLSKFRVLQALFESSASDEEKEWFEYVLKKHGDQKDLLGLPYEMHLLQVWSNLPKDSSVESRLAALGHDLIEDTDETVESLLSRGLSFRTVRLIDGMTRKADSLTYQERIECLSQSSDTELIDLKLADINSNLDPLRTAALPESSKSLLTRYTRAKETLEKAKLSKMLKAKAR